ncbi:DnaB-like helicase C-terminal domain-containing protein [Streptomyces sp. C36]|uniref:DnaB-like helicase C-terminal domain-containing protein n=1 Tax=Streptomyces sp. C36 TaxID=3237122 RepID=UPI0034C67D92
MAQHASGATPGSPGRRWGIDEARKALYDLVEAAATTGQSVLIGRGAKCAVLSPLSHLDAIRQDLSTLPATPVTTARKKLGDLLAAAATGTPQLLLHRRTPAAVLLPATPPAAAAATPASAAHATTPTPGSTLPNPAPATRRLTALDEVLDEVLTPGAPGPSCQAASFGLDALDDMLGGLRPGTLTLVAAAPGAGGSLLTAAAARHTALTRQLPVLYAASGLTRADIAARIIAAETPVDYRRLRSGALTASEEQDASATRARLAGAPLHLDDGADLTAEAITQTVPDITGLALVVVDRLQYAHDPVVPLSGPALPAVTRALAHLARTRNIPVLAALDTDIPDVVAALDPDVALTLTRTGEHTQVTVAERDFGPQATIKLRAQLAYARFTDAVTTPASSPVQTAEALSAPPAPVVDTTQAELFEAALPYLSGSSTGVSTRVISILAALREATTTNATTLPGLRAAAIDLAASGLRVPDTGEGRRLAVALQAFAAASCTTTPESTAGDTANSPHQVASTHSTPAPVESPATAAPRPVWQQQRVSSAKASLSAFISDRVGRALEAHGGDADAALKALAGSGGSAIPDVMELFEATRVETNYQHTTYPKLPEPLTRKRRDGADEVWEARPKFTNPSVLSGTETTELDVNAAYLAALQSAHLPVRTITHNPEGWDDLANYGKGLDLSGICRIDPVDWEHPELPHPLGDDRETSGTLWVPTSVVLSLKDFASPSYGELCTLPVIREAYVAKGSASLFKTLVNVLNEARMHAILEGDELTKAYIAAMYAKLVSTMGDSRKNHELRRPEWQHIIRGQAFSNLRRKAIRAHQAGLTVVQVGGTDELHLAGDVWAARWNGKPLFVEGRALSQIKVKKFSRKGEK